MEEAKNVLIIDDNIQLQRELKKILLQLYCNIFQLLDSDGFKRYKNGSFDAVLLDHNFPGAIKAPEIASHFQAKNTLVFGISSEDYNQENYIHPDKYLGKHITKIAGVLAQKFNMEEVLAL